MGCSGPASFRPFSDTLFSEGVSPLGVLIELAVPPPEEVDPPVCRLRGAGDGGVLWAKDGESGGVRLLLEPVLGAGVGGKDLGRERTFCSWVGPGELVLRWYGFGDEDPDSSTSTVTPSSMALSARGCGRSSLGGSSLCLVVADTTPCTK